MGDFSYHKTGFPCPICGGVTECRRNNKNGDVHCHRGDRYSAPSGWFYRYDDKPGFKIFTSENYDHYTSDQFKRRAQLAEERRKEEKAAKRRGETIEPIKTWSEKAFELVRDDKRTMNDRQRERLLEELGRDDFAPELLGAEFLANDGGNYPCWVFPMSSPNGEVTGYSLRYRKEDHGEIKKGRSKESRGHAGLFLPTTRVGDDASPILLPEGASDTLALLSMGICTVGRYNDKAITNMAELLRHSPPGRRIIIVGERDQKANGKWPGREGAETVARNLSVALNRVIYVALPPVGYKDTREWCNAHPETPIADLGPVYLAHVLETADPFTPDDEPKVNADAINTIRDYSHALDGYRAIDSRPSLSPPSSSSGDDHRVYCPDPKHSLYRNDRKKKTMVMFHSCKRLTCPVCLLSKKRQYIATVEHHIDDYESYSGAESMHLFYCDKLDWETVTAAIRKTDNGHYFSIELADRRVLVIASDRPATSKISAYREISFEDAKSKLCSTIHQMEEIGVKKLNPSRSWKLLEKMRSPSFQGWRRISGLATTTASILRILEYHKIKRQPLTFPGIFSDWRAWQWDDNGIVWDDVVGDLILGEVCSPITFETICNAFNGPPIMPSVHSPPLETSSCW